jgi:hypothetical protein
MVAVGREVVGMEEGGEQTPHIRHFATSLNAEVPTTAFAFAYALGRGQRRAGGPLWKRQEIRDGPGDFARAVICLRLLEAQPQPV